MTATPESSPAVPQPAAPSKPRRRWFRFLYQFSLRTMLIGMTLAAVACWWFLQPPVQEAELAGRYLKLRRQVRLKVDTSVAPNAADAIDIDSNPMVHVSVGTWQLRDDNADLLADGRYLNDLPHGKWTLWYPSGRKAAEGEAFRGGRAGLWRMWDEHGTLRSEVTYRAVAPAKPTHWNRVAAPRAWRGGGASFMLIGPIGQLAPPWTPPNLPRLPEPHVAERHGECRVWYASGKLQFEGQYDADQRDGMWKFYDEQGNVTEAGEYEADLREGEWTTLTSGVRKLPDDNASPVPPDHREADASRSPGSITFIAGRTQAEHDALLARLRADLASNSIRRQVAAAARLEDLAHAWPLLQELLQSGNTEAKVLALRLLTKHEALSPEMYSQIDPLIADDDPRLALRAMLAVYVLSQERRSELHPRLMQAVDASANRDLQLDVLTTMCDAHADQRQAVFMKIVEILASDDDAGQVEAYLSPDWQRLTHLKADPVPLLAHSFVHSDARVRVFILLVLEQLVESGEGELPIATGTAGNAEITWPISPTVQAVIDKAKTDPDPAVRQQAEAIGHQPQFNGTPGFF